MADSERRQRGVEMMKKVYAGDVVTPPAGVMPFSDLMLEQLFAEVWTREAYAALIGIVKSLPIHWRFFVKHKVFEQIARLPPEESSGDPAQVRDAYAQVVAEFPQLRAFVQQAAE
jgi:hypothetical protein